jgi:hypothetical protein
LYGYGQLRKDVAFFASIFLQILKPHSIDKVLLNSHFI